MSKKSVIALGLSLAMTFSLVACGDSATSNENKSTEVSTSTESSVASSESEVKEFDPRSITEGVTLTIAVATDDEVIDFNTNKATLIIEEKFGVDLVFEDYASASFKDKMNVMINGGDKLPDIIFGNGTKGLNDFQNSWSSSGAILELSDFYANPDYAKYINIAIEREGDFVSTMKDADGKIWGIPKYYPSVNDATARRLWINTEYAKACGFEKMPTTTEEFFELCKAFVAAGDLNGNGIDDEVIFTSYAPISQPWFRFLMNPFAEAWDDEVLEVKDGKLEASYTTDGWKEGLKYIKRFFDEGLLDTTILTQDSAAYKAIAYDPSMCVLADFNYMARMVGADALETQKCQLAYSYVCALEGPRGVEAYYNDPVAYPGAMITTDCKNPEAAFIVLDYFMSEEMSIRNRWGEEGENWDFWENVDPSKLPEGVTVEKLKEMNGEKATWLDYGNTEYWGQGNPQNAGYMLAGPSIQFTGFQGLILDPNSKDELVAATSEWNTLLIKMWDEMVALRPKEEERIVQLKMTTEEADAIAETATLVKEYWRQAAANFVTGVWDIDEYWSTYLSELEKLGVNDLVAVYQAAYDRSK